MKSERVILICDLCERSEDEAEGVATRALHVDRIDVEAEVCTDCWARVIAPLVPLAKVGRRPKPKARRLVVQGGVSQWPDSPWQFTHHAMMRCGERGIDPEQVVEACDHPEISRPAKLPEAYIRERAGIKVVVIPGRHVIITASRRDSEGGVSLDVEAQRALGDDAA